MIYRTLILFLGFVVGFVSATVVFYSFRYRDLRDEEGKKIGFFKRGIVGQQIAHKNRNLEKLRGYIKQNKELSNLDIQRHLKVSSSTAVRYMNELEKKDEVEQIGKTGKYTTYKSK